MKRLRLFVADLDVDAAEYWFLSLLDHWVAFSTKPLQRSHPFLEENSRLIHSKLVSKATRWSPTRCGTDLMTQISRVCVKSAGTQGPDCHSSALYLLGALLLLTCPELLYFFCTLPPYIFTLEIDFFILLSWFVYCGTVGTGETQFQSSVFPTFCRSGSEAVLRGSAEIVHAETVSQWQQVQRWRSAFYWNEVFLCVHADKKTEIAPMEL